MAEEQGGQKKGALDSLKNTGGDLGKKAWQIAGMFPGGQGWCCVAGCGCFALIIVILIIMIAMSLMATGMGEDTAINSGEGAFAGACGIPSPYNQIFEKAGSKWKVQSAFLAAIFVREHGPAQRYKSGYSKCTSSSIDFPEKECGDPNAIVRWETSSAGALGPMQFMPGTWPGYAQDGNGDGKKEPQNITDAAFAAAKYLALAGAGGNTGDLDKLRDAASIYNSGRPWSRGQHIAETARYVPRVISSYQGFLCIGNNAGPIVNGCMNVPQYNGTSGQCGRTSQDMTISYFNRGWGLRQKVLTLSTVKNNSGKPYVGYSVGSWAYGGSGVLNRINTSLSKGFPVIYYSDGICSGIHIFVITGYNPSTGLYCANNTWGNEKNVTKICGKTLTANTLIRYNRAQDAGISLMYVP